MLFFQKIILFFICLNVFCNKKNINITNLTEKNIFEIKNDLYFLKKINIEFVNDTLDKKILEENIYSLLTIDEGSNINLKNSTISTNISRLKKAFKFINNITFYGDLDSDNQLTITIKIENFEKIKQIDAIGLKVNKKKLGELQDSYVGKLLTNKITTELKKKIKKVSKTDLLLKIITESGKEYSYFITNKKGKKNYFVDFVKVVGNNNIKTDDIIKNLVLKGAKYYSFGYNLLTLIKDGKVNNFNLFKSIETLRSKFFIWENIFFDKEKLRNDKNKIIELYVSKGFLDAEISKVEVKVDTYKPNIDITYNINEGKQYFVGNIDFVGNKNVNSKKLREMIKINKGDPFDYIYFKNIISDSSPFGMGNNIKNYYNTIGYLKCNITLKIKSIKNNVVDVVFSIDEGEKVVINKIVVTGNRYVNSTEFYKSSFLFPGDTYNHEKYIATQQNIMRNEFLNPKKSFVTIDNENNLQIVVDEKIGIKPILNLSTQKIKENSCCKCCDCCGIGPAINIGCELTNLNFKKLLHINNPRYSFLGAGDVVKFQITYSPLDAKLNVELSGTIRKITRGIGAGLHLRYSRYKGDIDKKSKDFSKYESEYSKKEDEGCCNYLVHDFSFSNTIIFSNFTNTVTDVFRPINLSAKFGENSMKIYKYYLDLNIFNEFKYSTLSNGFWENTGLEASLSCIITNTFLFFVNDSNRRNL